MRKLWLSAADLYPCLRIVWLWSLVVVGPALAETLIVRSDGAGDYDSIQDAVEASSDGDTLLITGTFNESVDVSDRQLTFAGQGEAIVDPERSGRCFRFSGDADCSIVGLTLRGGGGVETGGAVQAEGRARLTILQSILESNEANTGAVLLSWPATVVSVIECTIRGNSSVVGQVVSTGFLTVSHCVIENNEGGTPVMVANDGQVRNNLFSDNTGRSAGAVAVLGEGTSEISNNIVRGCTGATGGISVEATGSVTVAHNTLIDNHASFSGGQAHFYGIRSADISQNIFSGGTGYSLVLLDDNVIFECNDVWSATGVRRYQGDDKTGEDGNISEDPLFCTDADPCLLDSSPCAEGNHPDGVDCGTIGARGTCCKNTPTETMSWGSVKRLFREKIDEAGDETTK